MSRRASPPSGFERGALAVLGLAIVSIWAINWGGPEGIALAQTTPVFPIENAGALLLLILLLVALNALFVASETAVELLTPLLAKYPPKEQWADRLQSVLDNKQKFAAACGLGSQLARLGLIFVGLLLAQGIAFLIFGADQITFGRILLVALLVAVPIVLINLAIGELVPKSYASVHTNTVACRLFGFICATSAVFSLPASLIVSAANLLTKRFGGRASFAMANQTEEQIKSLVESAQETGEIEVDEKELLHSVFEFTDTVVREVMTPRVDLEAMPLNAKPEEIASVIEATGHSRIPIFEDSDDQIVGVIHAKDLLMAMVSGKPMNLRSLMRAPLFIPENMNLQEALTEMRLTRSQMAIVQDEFGGTAGIVTTEDIVEELVGDIIDEYDTEEPAMVKTENGFIFDGKTHIDDVNEEMGTRFESDEFDTIGGFVFGLFGRQPKDGESIPFEDFRFRVVETDGKRILKLGIEPASPGPDVVDFEG